MSDNREKLSESSPSSEEAFADAVEALEFDEVAEAMEELAVETDFSLVVLEKCFSQCISDGSLRTQDYVQGYRELFKFLTMMGTVFGWVASDVKVKTDILQKYLEGEHKDKYTTIKGMIDYEVEEKLIKTKSKDDPSGSRTLLRLHRALEYITQFLGDLQNIAEDDKCSVVSREAYESTLMKYHPWIVQKAAKVAMGLLPTKKGLVNKLVPSGEPDDIKKAHEDFPKAVESMKKVYQATQQFYHDNDLLDIP